MIGRLLYVMRLRQVAARVQERAELRLDDRERTARELQDNLLQGLHGLTLRFQIIADQTSPEHQTFNLIRDVLARADAMLIEGRECVHSPPLSDDGLPEQLARLADDGCLDERTRIELILSGAPRALGTGIANDLAQVAREAMMNACRHAHATRIRLFLFYARNELCLVTEDNGSGVNLASLSRVHGGLGRMQKYASSLHGALVIQSRRGWGTALSITVPARYAYAQETMTINNASP